MRRTAQPAKAEPPLAEEGSLPHPVHLQAATPLDATLQVSRRLSRAVSTSSCPPTAAAAAAVPPPARWCKHPAVVQAEAAKAAPLLAWHPAKQRLVAVTPTALVEYDAVSGTRRNLAEVSGTPLRCAYTPSGAAVVLLTKVGCAAPLLSLAVIFGRFLHFPVFCCCCPASVRSVATQWPPCLAALTHLLLLHCLSCRSAASTPGPPPAGGAACCCHLTPSMPTRSWRRA